MGSDLFKLLVAILKHEESEKLFLGDLVDIFYLHGFAQLQKDLFVEALVVDAESEEFMKELRYLALIEVALFGFVKAIDVFGEIAELLCKSLSVILIDSLSEFHVNIGKQNVQQEEQADKQEHDEEQAVEIAYFVGWQHDVRKVGSCQQN